MKSITIDGTEYIPKADAPPAGARTVCVLERGWIFVGDRTVDDAGRITLTNARNLRKWEKDGFGGVLLDPKAAGAQLDPCPTLSYEASAELFTHPVSDDWGW